MTSQKPCLNLAQDPGHGSREAWLRVIFPPPPPWTALLTAATYSHASDLPGSGPTTLVSLPVSNTWALLPRVSLTSVLWQERSHGRVLSEVAPTSDLGLASFSQVRARWQQAGPWLFHGGRSQRLTFPAGMRSFGYRPSVCSLPHLFYLRFS